MKTEVEKICEGTRTTIQQIMDSQAVAKPDANSHPAVSAQTDFAELDKDLKNDLEKLHQRLESMVKDVANSVKMIADYKTAYAETYKKIPVDYAAIQEIKSTIKGQPKPLSQSIVSITLSNFR
jgi:uncharacterized lipoprotein YehR (DUF1307 family)